MFLLHFVHEVNVLLLLSSGFSLCFFSFIFRGVPPVRGTFLRSPHPHLRILGLLQRPLSPRKTLSGEAFPLAICWPTYHTKYHCRWKRKANSSACHNVLRTSFFAAQKSVRGSHICRLPPILSSLEAAASTPTLFRIRRCPRLIIVRSRSTIFSCSIPERGPRRESANSCPLRAAQGGAQRRRGGGKERRPRGPAGLASLARAGLAVAPHAPSSPIRDGGRAQLGAPYARLDVGNAVQRAPKQGAPDGRVVRRWAGRRSRRSPQAEQVSERLLVQLRPFSLGLTDGC